MAKERYSLEILEIKTHDFEEAKGKLKQWECLEKPLPPLEEVEEKTCWLFDHDVSGEEFNGVIRAIREHISSHQEYLIKMADNLKDVYKAFEALDKDYIAGIVGSIRAAEKVSCEEQKDRADIKRLVEELKTSVAVLMKFKGEIEGLKKQLDGIQHLGDIDLLWNKSERLEKRVDAVCGDVDSVSRSMEQSSEDNKRLARRVRIVGVVAFVSVALSMIHALLNLFSFWK